MYSRATREKALALGRAGMPILRISRLMGVSRAAIRDWLQNPAGGVLVQADGRCFVCAGIACPNPAVYSYLLGQYLGDGYLVATVRVPKLRIACADAYPLIAAEADVAMETISGNRAGSVQSIGCSDHYSYWMHWPCVIPQHGPGRKHERPIVLAGWQCDIVADHPWPLIRGLIHSDGCRAINRVVVRGTPYRYPRYFFSNESRDILTIMGDALDRVGVAWRYNRPNCISIARREGVAAMDAKVGPKR